MTECFLCHKTLDGWEQDDNPISEHIHHSEECGWAITASIESRIGVENRSESHPLSERIRAARKATFQNSWPHEKKKGWKAKTEKVRVALSQ